MHKIKYKHLTAAINPIGAELSSLAASDNEFLWHGDEQFWTGRAPILFPIVGALKDGAMNYRGNRYELPRHGIARHSAFETIDCSDSGIALQLKADEQSVKYYPWNFELQVHFTLSDIGLEIRYDVFNHDDSEMLFTIGSHPAFALEINKQYNFRDYEISFDQPESFEIYRLNEVGLLDTKPQPLDHSGNSSAPGALRLCEEIFNDDALVFRDINSRRISLQRNGEVLLSVDTGGAPHLGIWAKPGAPFVCIEPWLGTSDFIDSSGAFEEKPDLQKLAPNQKYSHGIAISVAR